MDILSKIIRVAMLQSKIVEEPGPEEYRFVGRRGLTSTILSKEVDPTGDPVGPANKLIVAPDLFGSTILPNCGRLSIGAKSPLTGYIFDTDYEAVKNFFDVEPDVEENPVLKGENHEHRRNAH